jgi:alkylation response protein AidB-like acyl-CoA dehydrogenase
MTMRFSFTRDQLMFRDATRDLLSKHCPPSAVRAAWASESGRVPALWSKLAEIGVVGLTVPEEHGGLGLGELDLVLLLEEAGRAAAPEPLLETVAVGAPLLRDAGTARLRERWLPRVVSGDAVLAVGLEGAAHVPFAHEADLLIVQRGDELHAIERGDRELTRQPSVDGSRRLSSVAWTPRRETCFTAGEEARRAAALALDRGALAAAAELLGIARRLLDTTVEYVKVRHQFGKPIGSFQAIKHHLASALAELEFSRPLVYRAAWSCARGDGERSHHVSMAKSHASDAALTCAKAALQCHGAIGYTVEYDLHLWMKRAWALAAAWGGAAWHRARVGEAIFGGVEMQHAKHAMQHAK